MKLEYKKALFEVYTILENTEEEIRNKIPEKFIKFIKENMDANYNFKLQYGKGLAEQNLMEETKQILALIYRDYICTNEERKELLEKEHKKRIEKETENKEKYDINFEKIRENKKQENYEVNETQLIEITKEKWYKKLINKILKVFGIRK